MKIATVLGILVLPALVAIAPVRDVESQIFLGANQPVPGFYEGYVFFVDRPNYVKVYSPNGDLAFTALVENESAASVMSVAVDSNGDVAASYSNGSRAGIELMDSKGTKVGSLDTGRYLATHVAFGDDHSIWTFGWQREPTNPGIPSNEYMTVHHYAAGGTELGEYMPRSVFPKGLEPACFGWQERGIYIAADRIGLLACWGTTSIDPEWVELDLRGNVTGRWRAGTLHNRVALTHDGHVYSQDQANGSRQIYLLDRDSSKFEPVTWTIPGMMYGAAGDDLVFADWKTGMMHFRWYTQPQIRSAR
jgi:hypothetical protein